MSNIKLYMFQSGTQQCKVHDIKMNRGNGADYEIPVPWFLLVHPKGNVVIDGGLAAEGLARSARLLGRLRRFLQTRHGRKPGLRRAIGDARVIA